MTKQSSIKTVFSRSVARLTSNQHRLLSLIWTQILRGADPVPSQ